MFRTVIGTTLLALGVPAFAAQMASAVMIRGDGTESGRAHFHATDKGVMMSLEVSGMTPGVHGLHLHTTGACTGPDFTSAGGHWNPTNRKHGLESTEGAHMGDLPNLTIGADGKGKLQTILQGATLSGGAHPMLDADGTAIVMHAGPDDNKTDPSGNSGGRLLCGVVKAP